MWETFLELVRSWLLPLVLVTFQQQLGEVLGSFDVVLPVSYQEQQVVEVIDGDTIIVWLDGQEATVRLVGIDTPETKHPKKKIECFGPEASQHLKEMIEGRRVELLPDSIQPNEDRYGRLLRYVYLADGTSVNEHLVEQGWARVYTKADSQLQDRLLLLEAQAQREARGVWGACY